jgi:LmbE family N-acetylglucosaminyl deacetylase
MKRTALAVGAHPDDIEFMMAGTLILLKRAGYEIHYLNVANGSCGSAVFSRAETVRRRRREAQAAARLIGAIHHPSLVPDIEVFYEKRTLARLGAVIRRVKPRILLVHSPEDYMEDHTNAGRLAVTAAFCRGMRNFPTSPRAGAVGDPCTVYHALPYGLRDGLRRRIWAGEYVDISPVLAFKREMLACHKSQKEWLDHSQGLDSYLKTMEEMCREVGRMSRRFRYAEGWRRHSHLGFSPADRDPLAEALGRKVVVDPRYERRLNARP